MRNRIKICENRLPLAPQRSEVFVSQPLGEPKKVIPIFKASGGFLVVEVVVVVVVVVGLAIILRRAY